MTKQCLEDALRHSCAPKVPEVIAMPMGQIERSDLLMDHFFLFFFLSSCIFNVVIVVEIIVKYCCFR